MAVVPKAKRRNSERRKEHSRDAARSRRGREAEVFLDLAQEIPLPYDSVKLLDKTSIIRLTITYLKLRTLLAKDVAGNDPTSITSGHLEHKLNQLYHRALDGFLMVVASDGDVLYVTDNIASFLGLTQIDVMGQSIYDLSHPCDHDEIREMIGVKSHPSDDSGHHRDIFIRMKSTITSKGRNVHIKSASYKVISCSGHLKTVQVSLSGGEEEAVSFVVIIGQSIGHPLNVEVPLDSRTFVSRHSLDMKFTKCDESVHKLLGYRADEILGRSMYSYHHALDTETLDRAFKTLFCKGQASTGLYRFLAQRGGFVWLETHATVINNVATDKPEYVVCLNYVVSGVECEDVVFDVVQLCPKMLPPNDVNKTECDESEEASEASLVLGSCPDTYKDDEQDSEQMCMQFVTEKILEQGLKDKDDSESAMIHRMTCYLLDPSSEMSARDQSLYSINKPTLETHDVKTSDMAGHETEEGMTKNLSNSSLASLLDKMEDGMEMRAPYIPMDDLVFSSVETPLVQPYVSDSQLSCLMNSDPLLPSVCRDLSDPLASLFTMNLSESQAPSCVPPTPKSSGTKRSYVTRDVIDLTAAPCKVPRLDGTDLALSLDRSSGRQAPVTTVTMLTGPVIHVPPFTATQGDVQKQITSIETAPNQQVAFFPVANLIGAPDKKRPAAVEVGSGGQQTGGPPVVYLLLNGQLTPVTLSTDQQVPATTRCDAEVKVQSDQQMVGGSMGMRTDQGVKLQPKNIQSAVRGDSFGPGHFVLDLTSPGGRTMEMATSEATSAPQMERATKVQTNTRFLGPSNEQKMLMQTFAKIVDSPKMTANQMMTNLGGQEDRATSKPCTTLPNQRAVDRLTGLTSDQLLRLIAPSLRKPLHIIPNQKPFEQLMPRDGTATQGQYHQVGGNTCGAVNSTGRGGTDMVDGEAGLPLHLKLQSGCMPVKQVLPDFLKVLGSENEAKGPTKSDGLMSKVTILNGRGPQPLHLLQEGIAAARYPPGAGMGHLQVEGGSSGGVPRFFVPPGTTSAVVNARGQQQSQKPRAQVIIKSIQQQLAPALKGIGLQVAAPRTDGSNMLIRQNGPTSEAGYAQHLASTCSGSMVDTSGSSVLMNLLMKGVDVNYGYRLQPHMILDSQKQLNMG